MGRSHQSHLVRASDQSPGNILPALCEFLLLGNRERHTGAEYYYLLGDAEGVVSDVYDARYFLEDISVDSAALKQTLDAMNLV
jgi:hypothetical protein